MVPEEDIMALIENKQRLQQAARQIRRALNRWRAEGADTKPQRKTGS